MWCVQSQYQDPMNCAPPYSPDLALPISRSKKKKWSGERVSAPMTKLLAKHFKDLEKSYILEGIQKRWTNCVELKGDDVEK